MKNLSIALLLFLTFAFLSCEEKDENPSVTTTSLKALSASTFLAKASVSKGNIPIVDYGFYYSLGYSNNSPQYGAETKVSLGNKLPADTFSANIVINNLGYYSSDMSVYVRAYITNEKGTVYAKPLNSTILRLQVTNVYPNHGKAGDTVSISGNNFDAKPSNNLVSFNNINAQVVSATSTTLKVIVPQNINVNYWDNYVTIRVVSGSQTSEFNSSFSIGASPTSFSPSHGNWNTQIVIYGSGLSSSTVYFNDVAISTYNASSSSIYFNIPSSLNIKTGKFFVEKGGVKSEVPGGNFTMDKIQVSNFSSIKCLQGANIEIQATNVNPSTSLNQLLIANTSISSGYNSYDGKLQFTIPSGINKGKYSASLTNGIDTISLPGEIEIVVPEVTGISPTAGYPNSKYTITGKNFTNMSNTYVYFDNNSYWASVLDSTSVKGTVPTLEPGSYSVYVGVGNSKIKCPETFTILAPTLTSVTPTSGSASTSVIITGEGFGTSIYNVYVYFGSIAAYPMTVTDTKINVKVPSGVSSGKWMVSVYLNGYTIPTTLTFDVP